MGTTVKNSEGHWHIQYVPHEKNLIAGSLAKLGLAWNSNLQILDTSPFEVLEILQRDIVCNNV